MRHIMTFTRGSPTCAFGHLSGTGLLLGIYLPSARSLFRSSGYQKIVLCRYYTSASPLLDGPVASRHTKPSEEMQDVTAIDEFMNVVSASNTVS